MRKPSLSFSLSNFSGRSRDSALPFIPSDEVLAAAQQEQDARGCLFVSGHLCSRQKLLWRHLPPGEQGLGSLVPTGCVGMWKVTSWPALCTFCPVSVSTRPAGGLARFPCSLGNPAQLLGNRTQRLFRTHGRVTQGSLGCRSVGSVGSPGMHQLRFQFHSTKLTTLGMTAACSHDLLAGSMVNMERQEEVSGREWNRRLPPSHPTPLLAFSFCVNTIRFMICAAFPRKNLWIIVIGQSLWGLFTTPAGYRVRRRRKVELVASDRRIIQHTLIQ